MSQPTAAQKRKWQKVVEVGCMACRKEWLHTVPEIHHWREYGYRDHDKIFGLCPPHHRYTAAVDGVLNRERDKLEFAEEFGTDEELFNECMDLIA